MKYSIIIPVKNDEQVFSTINSYIIAKKDFSVECIVVCNGSDDCFISKLKNDFLDIIKLAVTPIANISNARNIGIHASRGEYIIFIDSDNRIPENYFESLENILLSNDVVVGTIIFDVDDDPFTLNQAWFHKYINNRTFGNHLFSPNIVIKKSLYSIVGYYDEILSGSEDGDWSDRFWNSPAKVLFTSDIFIFNAPERKSRKTKSWILYGFGSAYRGIRNLKAQKLSNLSLLSNYLGVWGLFFGVSLSLKQRLFILSFLYYFTLGYLHAIKIYTLKDTNYFLTRNEKLKHNSVSSSYKLL